MARKKKRTSLGILFWMAFILFVLVVFMVNRPRIQTVLENTGFVEIVSRRINGESEPADEDIPELDWEEEPDSGSENEADRDTSDTPSESTGEREAPEDSAPSSDEDSSDETSEDDQEQDEAPEDSGGNDSTGTDQQSEQGQSEQGQSGSEDRDGDGSDSSAGESEGERAGEPDGEATEDSDPDAATEEPNSLNLNMYYVRVTDDGAFPEPVERTIEYTDSPLTRTIRTLLDGPTSAEVGEGILNMIPDGTQLQRASVRNGVAYLDFNDAFRFNPMGVEGYRLQLQQIIYVTTQFSTVDRVQFLIEGERHEWLGGEGVYIGSPLGRNSFS